MEVEVRSVIRGQGLTYVQELSVDVAGIFLDQISIAFDNSLLALAQSDRLETFPDERGREWSSVADSREMPGVPKACP